jgi:hypothetical protein
MKRYKSAYARMVAKNHEYFPPQFADWVEDNHHIVRTFVAESLRVIERGRDHYGAHVIVQWIRHDTAMRVNGHSEFKISNNVFPYLARIFALAMPDRDYLFDYHRTNTPKQFVPKNRRRKSV